MQGRWSGTSPKQGLEPISFPLHKVSLPTRRTRLHYRANQPLFNMKTTFWEATGYEHEARSEDPRGGSEPDHSEDSDANNDTTDYDDQPS